MAPFLALEPPSLRATPPPTENSSGPENLLLQDPFPSQDFLFLTCAGLDGEYLFLISTENAIGDWST